jgi:signal transduction histidine kinase
MPTLLSPSWPKKNASANHLQLLSNAIKYSDKGNIEVSHEIENDLFVTHVKDEGVAILTKTKK